MGDHTNIMSSFMGGAYNDDEEDEGRQTASLMGNDDLKKKMKKKKKKKGEESTPPPSGSGGGNPLTAGEISMLPASERALYADKKGTDDAMQAALDMASAMAWMNAPAGNVDLDDPEIEPLNPVEEEPKPKAKSKKSKKADDKSAASEGKKKKEGSAS